MNMADTSVAKRYVYGLPSVQPENVGLSADRLNRIATVMQRFICREQVPGLLTVIARHGKIAHESVQGYADFSNQKPLKPETIFRIYSMTKPITGVAVMLLYEEGHFSLDDPIADYLPEFSAMKVWTKNGVINAKQPIRIRHLLTHTAGFTYSNQVNPVAELYATENLHGVFNRLLGETLAQHVTRLAALPLLSQPGTAWNYGESMGVLGRLVEVVSGQSLRDFLKARIFNPLVMPDTDFYVPPEKADRLAALYEQTPDGIMEKAPADGYGGNYCQKPSLEYGGAGLVGTAADYLRFAQMLLNGGELDGVRLLSPASVKQMMANHLGPEFGDKPLASLGHPATRKKGLGFGFTGAVTTDALANGAVVSNGTFGWGGWANTDFWIDPRQDLVGLVFTQLIPTTRLPNTLPVMQQMTYQALIND